MGDIEGLADTSAIIHSGLAIQNGTSNEKGMREEEYRLTLIINFTVHPISEPTVPVCKSLNCPSHVRCSSTIKYRVLPCRTLN